MKFLHTTDWQIGMKADFVRNAAKRVRDERLAAGTRVISFPFNLLEIWNKKML